MEYSETGWWSPVKAEGSTFDPDAPWNHVMHVAVKSSDARHWWSEQFLWQASQVVLKLKPLSQFLENDAPVAASVKDHASTAYVPPQPARAPQPKAGRPEAPWEKRKPPPGAAAPPPPAQKKPRTKDVTNKHSICHGFNTGKCTDAAQGRCGPNSCAKRAQFIHACDVCGEVGHVRKDCPTTSKPAAERPRRR